MSINTATRTAPVSYTFAPDTDRRMAETILANTREIGSVRIGLLPLDLLFVDYSYQRPTRSKVQKIAKDFDPNKAGFLLVSYRETDAKFAIIDGGNRYEAAKLIGLPSLPCQILTDLSVEQEALVFAAQNENRVRLTENDLLKAQVRAGEESAIGFKNLCKEFGIHLYIGQSHENRLVCTKTARRYYEQDADGLRWVFSMICRANWNTAQKGFSVYTITPLFNIYTAHAGNVNEIESKLLPAMQKIAPTLMMTKAHAIFDGYTRTAAMTSLMSHIVNGTIMSLDAPAA